MANEEHDSPPAASRQEMASVAFGAAIGAAIMLYMGFGWNLRGTDDSGLYNASVALFTWTMKVGGIAMALSAMLLWLGWRAILMVDALLAGVVGVVVVSISVLWILHNDTDGFLTGIFGLLFLFSARWSWVLHRGSSAAGAPWPGVSAASADRTAPERPPLPRVPEARQAAMDRLLSSKRREGAVESPRAEPVAPPPFVQTLPKAAAAEPKPPEHKDEPPPEGFLARLGRGDS